MNQVPAHKLESAAMLLEKETGLWEVVSQISVNRRRSVAHDEG